MSKPTSDPARSADSAAPAKPARRQRRRARPGTPPGTLIPDPHAHPTRLALFAYGPEGLVERELGDVGELEALRGKQRVLWLDVAGLRDHETLRRVGQWLGLHRLELEDVINVHQRAKVDAYGEHLFFVARMLDPHEVCATEQLSLFLGRDFVVTFQERPGDAFGPVRERLRSGGGTLRASGPDYLAYALLDAAVDAYFPVLEALGERLEKLEDALTNRPRRQHLGELHVLKRELLVLRRAVWPLREAVNQLHRDDCGLVHKETRPYLNDLYDHTVQLMDLIETYRELSSGLLEVYLSSMSHRLNEVMMVLTVIATIFIPLTWLSSIWGMNFKHMPELDWPWAYPAAVALMVAIGVALVVYFRRRGWIGAQTPRLPRADRRPPQPR